ncbi:nucleotide pyrophosphohydrolase [Nocardia yamanashiensis]|uniref:nucleotide pyrophosphohydrolase n=1 Tax=Nocardia yamanashiensis TaxID=209247 RepID=UPI001E47221B|nr:nucleotide pyrophosphohydrolase [Nocardia yamanashiensis]UGT40909.1 nucleotide pyrophosphohydrolase [Nocardia yamanashiensis]
MTMDELQDLVTDFSRRRDWERFHTPKNLVLALTGEVGELAELFQWLTPEESAALCESEQDRTRVEHEVADVLIYLMRLATVLDIDLAAAVQAKLKFNEQRYPVDLARGRAVKHSELR